MLLSLIVLVNILGKIQSISLRGFSRQPLGRNFLPVPNERYMTVTLCRGGRKTIGCPNQQLLHVFTAFYGKLSGHDCDDPIRNVRDEIPTCSSKDASTVVRESCHNQQSCDLYSEDSMYQNPCPEVMKYLFVSYTCQGRSNLLTRLKDVEDKFYQSRDYPNLNQLPHRRMDEPIQTTTVCDGRTGSINCPSLRLIHIKAAFYGRRAGRDCSGKLVREQIPTCIAPNTMKTIKDTCNRQQSCDLYADSNLYGASPCLGNTRYLYVAYSCEGHSNLENDLAGMLPPNSKAGYGSQGQQSVQSLRQQPAPAETAEMFHPNPVLDSQPYTETNLDSSYHPLKKSTVMRRIPIKASLCSHCDGDCNNFFCYGCGGCPEPPIEKQMYKLPFEKEDAALHDAFSTNQMKLSGVIFWPVPRTRQQIEREREQAFLRQQLLQQQSQQQYAEPRPEDITTEFKIQRDKTEHEQPFSGEEANDGDDDDDDSGSGDDSGDDDDDSDSFNNDETEPSSGMKENIMNIQVL